MLALHRTLSLRYLGRRWSRTLLVVLSIAVGVAALVATRAINDNMAEAGRNAFAPLAGYADLLVSNAEGVPADVLKRLQTARDRGELPGVKDIRPLILDHVLLPDLNNARALLVGTELDIGAVSRGLTDTKLGLEYEVTDTLSLLAAMSGVQQKVPAFVGATLAGEMPQPFGKLTVRAGTRDAKPIDVCGKLNASGPAAALGSRVIFMRLDDAANLLGDSGRYTRIDLTLTPEADRKEVETQVRDLLGGVVMVQTPQATYEQVNDVMKGVDISFTLGGVCALVVGLFLVYNALSVSVAERRHDIGILRSVGATRGQIAALFTGEALFLGLIGSLLGVPIGWGIAYLAQGTVQEMLTDLHGLDTIPLPRISPGLAVVALVSGTLTALLAALLPALQAAREEPADAVRRAPPILGTTARVVHAVVSLSILLAGVACAVVRGYLPDSDDRTIQWLKTMLVFSAPVLVMVGFLLATPLLAGVAARIVQPITRWFLGVPERLAADNLARSPGRTGLVIAALAAGVALMVETAGVMVSSEDAILGWVDRTVAADLIVTANSPVTSSGKTTPMSDELHREVAGLKAVRKVVPVRYARSEHDRRIIYVVAIGAADFYDRERMIDPYPGIDRFPDLKEPNTAIVSDNFAALHRVKVGDTIRVPARGHTLTLKVISTFRDYTWNRGTIFVDRDQYVAATGDNKIDILNVYVKDGEDVEKVRETLYNRWGAQESLVVLTHHETREGLRAQIRKLYSFGYAQEIMVGVVAALGMLMALLISVLQRRRELGLLRAVGASRGQVLRTVLAEATLMGLVGGVIGLAFGIPLEWYMIRILLLQEAGFVLPLSIPWTAAALVIALALALATVAGVGPALHAVRLRIADAIAYE